MVERGYILHKVRDVESATATFLKSTMLIGNLYFGPLEVTR